MARVLPVIVLIVVTIYCLVEVAQSDPERVRHAPRWLWAVAILVLPGVGAAAWLFAGRPASQTQRPKQRRPVAPDDDPDFLRKLRGL